MKKRALFFTLMLVLTLPAMAQFKLLHEFAGINDGMGPMGSLLLSGSTLYGMTGGSGFVGGGTIFKIQTDGTGYEILHEFTNDDGANPLGSLIISGTTLFGMTSGGGSYGQGTIFRMETDGSLFALLHEFAGGADDGGEPWGSLVLSGSTLYGMTETGGTSSEYGITMGTIFRIEIDGSGYAVMHKFAGSPSDGASPWGSLIVSGTTLFGMTRLGGANGWGMIFGIQTDGSGFSLLHSFNISDGASPLGSLILVDSTLYGMTGSGGSVDLGTVFKIGIDGNDFQTIHHFAGGFYDGAYPHGSLVYHGSALCGMTWSGRQDLFGTTFKIQPDGSRFSVLHLFAGGIDDGAEPCGDLITAGTALYGMTQKGGDEDHGVVFSLELPPGITVTSPSGGESWIAGSEHDITWDAIGTVGGVTIDYSLDDGSGWTDVGVDEANTGVYHWLVPGTYSSSCRVRVRETGGALYGVSGVFSIIPYTDEVISPPVRPTGPAAYEIFSQVTFSTGGSQSNWSDEVEYMFDWGDGTSSSWLAVNVTAATHWWGKPGMYQVRAKARCAGHPVESSWSESVEVLIYDCGFLEYISCNSPSQYKVLPEATWAQATGGGTWVTEAQVTDVTGGSKVYACFYTEKGKRGPFLLWDNSGGGRLSSAKFANLLETIEALDAGKFAYFGSVGAVEFITQDKSRRIQVTARTSNGNYSKTMSAVSRYGPNWAACDLSGVTYDVMIPNLTSNGTYRTRCGFFNPMGESVTVSMALFDANNNRIGNGFNKTLQGYGYTAFDPFEEAAAATDPGNQYDNVALIVSVGYIGKSGEVCCFGASANNATNDPAAHLPTYFNYSLAENGPDELQLLPETIWAPASGGGTWATEVQVVDESGGSEVSVNFYYGNGNRRGPFLLWTGGAPGSKVKYANILERLAALDPEFDYFGRVGALELRTQGFSMENDHWINVASRTANGDYSKTFPGLKLVDAETADTSRIMLIQNLTNNAAYRSACGFYNPTTEPVTVEFTLLGGGGTAIGAPFTKTLAGHDFQSFNPFTEIGGVYPGGYYDNMVLRVRPTMGAGKVMCFGATANNESNDPAAHLAVQGQ